MVLPPALRIGPTSDALNAWRWEDKGATDSKRNPALEARTPKSPLQMSVQTLD
jgi:hypothetical protein